ncbi:phage antirepressor KilAC domain-containing protein [Paraburkholderia sediminicola]|uniref:phage antirepressor KilAC domain-containing protein n=1 Tax=Paraburkholderia sediminicola TaxID=458836 RepID=UPI0038B9A250
MTNLLTTAASVTMSSLELVDFINEIRDEAPLTHANFLAKVPKVLGETSHSFECDLSDSYGRARRAYRFPKREACLMAMSYSYELQARVFDRMTALEEAARPQLPDFNNPAVAARAWAEQYELAAQRQTQLEQQKPAVEYAEALRGTDEWIPMSVMAKKLKQAGYETGLKRLFDTLKADHVLISSSEPYQRYADLFFIDTFTREDSHGRKVATETLRVTQKGEEFLLKKYATKRPTQRAAALDGPKGLGGFTKALSKAA